MSDTCVNCDDDEHGPLTGKRTESDATEAGDDERDLTKEELDRIRESAERIRGVLDDANERALEEQKNEIREHLAEAMLVRALGQDDEVVYRRKLGDDVQVSAAMDLLRQRKSYTALLSVDAGNDAGK
jgi:hypothetical protein